jgi:glutathione S-transferase
VVILYGHPFAMFVWKALIALEERGVRYEFRTPETGHQEYQAVLTEHQPGAQIPVLVDGNRVVIETNVIVEYIDRTAPGGPQLLPVDPLVALEARQMADVFDDYVAINMQRIVSDQLRPAEHRSPYGVQQAKDELDEAYTWLERWMTAREWAACAAFSMADISAAGALFYADWVHPMAGRFPQLEAYRARLLARPSVARVVDGARPYRHLFPFTPPDRD